MIVTVVIPSDGQCGKLVGELSNSVFCLHRKTVHWKPISLPALQGIVEPTFLSRPYNAL
jgi:hypothetical protein